MSIGNHYPCRHPPEEVSALRDRDHHVLALQGTVVARSSVPLQLGDHAMRKVQLDRNGIPAITMLDLTELVSARRF